MNESKHFINNYAPVFFDLWMHRFHLDVDPEEHLRHSSYGIHHLFLEACQTLYDHIMHSFIHRYFFLCECFLDMIVEVHFKFFFYVILSETNMVHRVGEKFVKLLRKVNSSVAIFGDLCHPFVTCE